MIYEFDSKENMMILDEIENFNVEHIFDCGQCFRWKKENDGSYTGVAYNKVINVKSKGNKVEIRNTNIQDFKNIWYNYFDLNRDYSEIKKHICKDDIMKKAIEFGSGLRILKQDSREVLMSYIISANNNIPRIMGSIDSLSKKLGRKLIYKDKEYYTFPTLKKISNASIELLKDTKIGFRARYIKGTAKDESEANFLNHARDYDTEVARKVLQKYVGVGEKVADCTLLFSGIKHDVFPTDVWVKRIIEELYIGREATLKEIQQFAKDYFGEYAGFAQQYLFYYARENKIGIKK